MSRSEVKFDRWNNREERTWPYHIFQKYSLELEKMMQSHFTSTKYLYSDLASKGANWTDDVNTHFTFDNSKKSGLYSDLEDFSTAYNQYDNWSNLNALMAISSNLETYMATVISLALESDPGILLNSTMQIDGAKPLKYNEHRKDIYENYVISCTKGDWSSRSSSYQKIFGYLPNAIKDNIGMLDKIREVRNNVGHALGRDIKESRKHGVLTILPITKLTRERLSIYKQLIWKVTKEIDQHLLTTHIGEYQIIHFYHEQYTLLSTEKNLTIRANNFKKMVGKFGDQNAGIPGKLFCKELVNYYEAL